MIKGIKIDYKGKELTVAIYEQQIWFSILDVQDFIDIGLNILHLEESANLNINGNFTQMISEFGLYRLLCLTNNDVAKNFRKWLINDAIYRLRKYGCYKLSIAEQKEKLINEIVELKGNNSETDKLKFFSLDKLKLEKALLEKTVDQVEKERETVKKRREIKGDFPYARVDFEDDYDISMAVKNLIWCKENLDEYMVWINDNECFLSEKFIQYLKDGDYRW